MIIGYCNIGREQKKCRTVSAICHNIRLMQCLISDYHCSSTKCLINDYHCSSTTKSGRKSTKKKRKDYVEEYSDSEEEEESESEEEVYYEAPKKKAPPKEQFPPVGEMVVECIKALKDNPK